MSVRGRGKKRLKEERKEIEEFAAWRRLGLHRDPTVAGSIPASDESCCSSEVEQRTNTWAADSRRRKTPGWRGGELLRLSHDVGLRLRSSAR